MLRVAGSLLAVVLVAGAFGVRLPPVPHVFVETEVNPSAPRPALPPVSNARVFTVNLSWHLFLYLTTAGAAYLVFHVLGKRWLAARQIQPRATEGASIRRDILYSLSSAIIFALVGLLTHHFFAQGWTKLYRRIEHYGWAYFWFSLVAMIVLHDTWFYWTHRLMHWRRLFPLMHRVHHLSQTPTPWSALAFHPTEAVVQAMVFPLVAMLVPLHPFVALLWLVYMIVINVWGHLGFELLPAGFRRHWLFRWHNTTTHHDMHHQHVNGNYSLYFNFWDRVMRTNHRDY
jgi:sterol desaturase/sphingolipid hydroxylase (fatty acid hydroxylase superfamily)